MHSESHGRQTTTRYDSDYSSRFCAGDVQSSLSQRCPDVVRSVGRDANTGRTATLLWVTPGRDCKLRQRGRWCGMARYYFHVRSKHYDLLDETGKVLGSAREAHIHAQMLIQKWQYDLCFPEWSRFVDDRNLRWFREHRACRRLSAPNSLVGAFAQKVRGGRQNTATTSLKREGDNSVWPRYSAPRIATETLPMRPSLILFGFVLALIGAPSAHAVEKPKSSQTIWYERIEAGCKADAKKYYSAIHFQKRRAFVKHCIDRAYR